MHNLQVCGSRASVTSVYALKLQILAGIITAMEIAGRLARGVSTILGLTVGTMLSRHTSAGPSEWRESSIALYTLSCSKIDHSFRLERRNGETGLICNLRRYKN